MAAVGGVVALQLALGLASGPGAIVLSDVTHVVVALGAAVLLIGESSHRQGLDRTAWALFGVGVGLLGLGDLTWGWYELALGVVPPFPGLPDLFYLAPYPAFGDPPDWPAARKPHPGATRRMDCGGDGAGHRGHRTV